MTKKATKAEGSADLKDIAEELKTLGRKLIDAGNHISESKEAKKAMKGIKEGLSQANEDLKSGKLAEDIKKEILSAIKFFNQKLDQFSNNKK